MRAIRNATRRAVRLAVAAAGVAALSACTEDLGTGSTCPALCPDEALATRDTVLDAVVLDTTLAGYPATGAEGVLALIQRGDSAETRVVVRFDTIPTTFTPTGGSATPYTQLTSAVLTVALDSAGTSLPGALTVDAYDVGGADTARAELLPLFRADRLIGTATFASRAALGDTLRLPLDPARVLPRIQGALGLRVGLVLRGTTGQLSLGSTEGSGGGGPRLRLRTPGDTATQTVTPTSRATTGGASAAAELRDFAFVVRGPAAPAPAVLAAGGVFGRRSLLQFAVPPAVLDSATVVRATLELTQLPNRAAANRSAPVTAYIQPVTAASALADTLATGALRDPGRVASFLCVPTSGTLVCPSTTTAALSAQYQLQSIVRTPVDSGPVRIEVASLVRLWQQPNTPATARVIVLRVPLTPGGPYEAQQGGELLVFSREAPAAVRPRLRVTYVTRSSYALP